MSFPSGLQYLTDSLSSDDWASFILCLPSGFPIELCTLRNSPLHLFQSCFNLQSQEFHTSAVTLPNRSASSHHEHKLPLTLAFQALTTKKTLLGLNLSRTCYKEWAFTSAFQLSVPYSNKIHFFKQCLCLKLRKLPHGFRGESFPELPGREGRWQTTTW